MNIEEIRTYCLSKPFSSERFPFDEHTLVFFVEDKMFALTGLDNPEAIVNLKCDPERAIELRENHDEITPGFHMNKKHWNSVHSERLSNKLVQQLIDHSYDLVVSGFSFKKKKELGIEN